MKNFKADFKKKIGNSNSPTNLPPMPKCGYSPNRYQNIGGVIVPKIYPTARENLIYHGSAHPTFNRPKASKREKFLIKAGELAWLLQAYKDNKKSILKKIDEIKPAISEKLKEWLEFGEKEILKTETELETVIRQLEKL